MVTRPGQLSLGIHGFSADLEGSDLTGRTKKQKTSDISLLTCTRHLAAPTTNMAESKVS